jgi:hypothetical protein
MFGAMVLVGASNCVADAARGGRSDRSCATAGEPIDARTNAAAAEILHEVGNRFFPLISSPNKGFVPITPGAPVRATWSKIRCD